ncbi:MAG: glycosyl hydrolase family 18 protein [bacterium]
MAKRIYELIDSAPRAGIAAVIGILLIVASPFTGKCQPRVVGYYPAWMKTTLPADKVRFDILTHLNHAFAWPLADGSITGYNDLNHPELIDATHNAGRKILIALGGFGQSQHFSAMASDSTTRKQFINNLIHFIETHEYDGVDFDWEFPETPADRTNLTVLIKEVRAAFNNENPSLLVTTVAFPTDFNGRWNNYEALAAEVDWFNLMTYDFHGTWTSHAGHNAPLYAPVTDVDGSVHAGVQYLSNSRRISKEKIHLGLPFYGREFNASSLYGPSTGGGDLTYSAIAPRLTSGWEYFWDDVSKVPYLLNANRTGLVTFDDTLSLRLKCEYAKQNGLAGVMIWALGQDILNDTQPLIEAVGRAMATGTGIDARGEGVVRDFVLWNNYPNPFNPSTTIAFELARDMPVKLFVYDLNGKLVAVLKNGMAKQGRNALIWQATDYASGIYFCKLEAGAFSRAKKMILTK